MLDSTCGHVEAGAPPGSHDRRRSMAWGWRLALLFSMLLVASAPAHAATHLTKRTAERKVTLAVHRSAPTATNVRAACRRPRRGTATCGVRYSASGRSCSDRRVTVRSSHGRLTVLGLHAACTAPAAGTTSPPPAPPAQTPPAQTQPPAAPTQTPAAQDQTPPADTGSGCAQPGVHCAVDNCPTGTFGPNCAVSGGPTGPITPGNPTCADGGQLVYYFEYWGGLATDGQYHGFERYRRVTTCGWQFYDADWSIWYDAPVSYQAWGNVTFQGYYCSYHRTEACGT